MLFGDPNRIAIEYRLYEEPEGKWLEGYLRYWACGQRIGNYDICLSIRDVLFQWEGIAHDAGNRMSPSLDRLDTESLFYTLHTSM